MERRCFLQFGLSGLSALWLSDLAGDAAAEPGRVQKPKAPASACIVLWLNGGPSHVDTFDPKPSSKTGGPFKAIATRAPGVKLSEHLPLLAERMNRVALIRGMTSREGNHQRARFLAHTGYSPNPTVVHPGFGAWVAHENGAANAELPGFVSVGGPSEGGGFLGQRLSPLVVLEAGAPPANVGPPRRVDDPRYASRRAALDFLERGFAQETRDAQVDSRRAVFAEATKLMESPKLAAFEFADESDKTKKAYGDSDFGRGCLLARRLVESGVKYVEVQLDGWDTHKDNFGRTKNLLAQFDPAIAALLRDLEERKRLDSTLVAAFGEFGRSPAINGDEGRDHHPAAWSALLAGGGIKGGVVHGATDETGDKVTENATGVPDLFATMATQLGLDPARSLEAKSGRPISVTDHGKPIRAILGG